MRRWPVCCILFLLANAAEAKDRGSPPAGGEALIEWCHHTVVRRHGRPAPWPERPHRKVFSSRHPLR